MQLVVNGQDLSKASLILGSFTFVQDISAVKNRAVHASRIQTRIHGIFFVKYKTVPASKVSFTWNGVTEGPCCITSQRAALQSDVHCLHHETD